MQDDVGVRVGLAVAAIAACVAGCIACSGSSADSADGQSGAGAPTSDATTGPAAPFPPPSPLPDGFNLDGGAAFDGNPAAFDSGIPSNPADDPPLDPNLRTMWAVDGANQLVRFTAHAPGTVTARALTGLAAGERVTGIDIRPADGKLYAIGSTSRLYVIDRKTGVAKALGVSPAAR